MNPMERLRAAILADVVEDASMLGELSEWHSDLVEAWNAVPGVVPITDADVDDEFDD